MFKECFKGGTKSGKEKRKNAFETKYLNAINYCHGSRDRPSLYFCHTIYSTGRLSSRKWTCRGLVLEFQTLTSPRPWNSVVVAVEFVGPALKVRRENHVERNRFQTNVTFLEHLRIYDERDILSNEIFYFLGTVIIWIERYDQFEQDISIPSIRSYLTIRMSYVCRKYLTRLEQLMIWTKEKHVLGYKNPSITKFEWKTTSLNDLLIRCERKFKNQKDITFLLDQVISMNKVHTRQWNN